jgi:hypothetical protein
MSNMTFFASLFKLVSQLFFCLILFVFARFEMCFVWFCLLDSSYNFFLLQQDEGMPITTISLDCLDIWKWSFSYSCVQCIVVASTHWSLRMWGWTLSNFAKLLIYDNPLLHIQYWMSELFHWLTFAEYVQGIEEWKTNMQ